MKFLIPLLCLLIAQGSYAAEEPAALVELRQGWETQRSEAQAKVDKLYLEELEELKKILRGCAAAESLKLTSRTA